MLRTAGLMSSVSCFDFT